MSASFVDPIVGAALFLLIHIASLAPLGACRKRRRECIGGMASLIDKREGRIDAVELVLAGVFGLAADDAYRSHRKRLQASANP